VKRRETRCEGRGSVPGHKRGHNAPSPHPLGSVRLTPKQGGAAGGGALPARDHIVLTRRPGLRFVGGRGSYLRGSEKARKNEKPATRVCGLAQPLRPSSRRRPAGAGRAPGERLRRIGVLFISQANFRNSKTGRFQRLSASIGRFAATSGRMFAAPSSKKTVNPGSNASSSCA
jgi:hypothetical protein